MIPDSDSMAHLVVVLLAQQLLEWRAVLGADLVVVALQEGQQRLVPHHRHLPRFVRKAHKVVHQRVHLRAERGLLIAIVFNTSLQDPHGSCKQENVAQT